MGVLKKSTPRKSETKVIPDENDGAAAYTTRADDNSFTNETEIAEESGQLALDVFQTATEIVIIAAIAGVMLDDLAIHITDEILTISGKRKFQFKVEPSDYFTQECFWGNFSRSVILPESVDTSRVRASFKNGILTIRIPKVEKIRMRVVEIREE